MTELYPLIMDTIKNNQIAEIKIKGNSMRPFLKDQVSIVGLKALTTRPKRYHIYFFKIDNKYILHRFMTRQKENYFFRGDALYKFEEVDKSDIFAEVAYVINGENVIHPYSFWNLLKVNFYMTYKRMKILARYMIGRDHE